MPLFLFDCNLVLLLQPAAATQGTGILHPEATRRSETEGGGTASIAIQITILSGLVYAYRYAHLCSCAAVVFSEDATYTDQRASPIDVGSPPPQEAREALFDTVLSTVGD